jgi:hypothetical protein
LNEQPVVKMQEGRAVTSAHATLKVGLLVHRHLSQNW